MLKNAEAARPGIGYVDDTGVYFSEGEISQVKRYANLDDLIMGTRASSFEWMPITMSQFYLSEEMLNREPYRLEGLSRSEGIIYLMLKHREIVTKNEIVEMLQVLVGTNFGPSSFHKLMSIDSRWKKGYKLEV